MARVKITKKVVDGLTPTPGRDTFLWDSELRGFGVRCRPASGDKYYFLKLRAGRRQRWLTIGRHGQPWTIEEARKEALRLLGQKAGGLDPAAQRDKLKTTSTVAELWEQFIKDREAGTGGGKKAIKPTTAREYKREYDKIIKPAIGQMRAIEVTPADMLNLHRKLAGSPYLANRVIALLSKVFNYAKPFGVCPREGNPAESVEKFTEKKRTSFLSTDELTRLGKALKDCLAGDLIDIYAASAVRLLLFTGCRLNEILTLEWAHVDTDNAVLNLEDSKTGAKTIQLPAPALLILSEIPKVKGNPFVIVGKLKGKHLVNLSKPWQQVRTKAKLPSLRIHDLRHSFGSVGVGAGLTLPLIGGLLGHRVPATTARYSHVQMDPLQQAVNVIGNRIAEALDKEEKKQIQR